MDSDNPSRYMAPTGLDWTISDSNITFAERCVSRVRAGEDESCLLGGKPPDETALKSIRRS